MSGTENINSAAQNVQLNDIEQQSQSGIDEQIQRETTNEKLTPAQKMDMILRGVSPAEMKKEIRKLRDEAAKYRKSTRIASAQKAAIELKAKEIERELQSLKSHNRELSIMRKLDNAGCMKSELVAKDIPADCENIDAFIEEYKEQNGFLFKNHKQSYGTTFKPSAIKNLSASQRMDAYIRSALGR